MQTLNKYKNLGGKMPDKANLPMIIKENKLDKIKNNMKRTGKFVGYSLATGGLIIGGVLFPPAFVPAIVGAYFTGQKALNNSVYKEYKDLAFITKQSKNNINIMQDSSKVSVLKELKGLTNIEKVRIYATTNYYRSF